MINAYQGDYRPEVGRCSRCGQGNIPVNKLFLAVSGEAEVGWHTVCKSCDDGDGSLRFHGRTIVELRDVTAFGSAEFDINPVELEVWSEFSEYWIHYC